VRLLGTLAHICYGPDARPVTQPVLSKCI